MISSPVDEIKNRLDIVEVIGSYIKLQKAGVNFRALCPFHSEKKPSFFVSPSRQIWHCFGGCGEGGDIFKFVMKIEGVEFGDALRILAQKAGVELKRERPELKTERQRLYEICELTARFFEKQLEASKTGQEAKKYLSDRGVAEESIKKWRIGYAPDVWQGLSDFLTSTGYEKAEIEKAGLALTSEKGSFYDRFRGRIIFPIFDLNSQIVGFGGRVFKEKDKQEIAKYVNTPQTILYDKSRILYGLDKAKMEIRKKDNCVLVEGYMDLIMASQAGSENIVATSGTALTPFQLKILKRYTNNLLTAFDMDVAGDAATKRGIDLAQSQGFNVKVITLPKDQDPADVASRSSEEWKSYIDQAKSILDFYFDTTFAKFDKQNPEGKAEISKILLPVIKRIPNRIIQSHWVRELAKKLETKEEDIEEELKKINPENRFENAPEAPEISANLPPKLRRELLEERIVVLALMSPKILSESAIFADWRAADFIKDQRIREILLCLGKNNGINLTELSPELVDLANYLSLKAEVEEIEEKEAPAELRNCLKQIQFMEVRDKLNRLSLEIKKAEDEKNFEKVVQLIEEFNRCSKSLCDLEAA